jgi:2-polyprenyl-3-methyl-5-hydroxy-6-metoxy-1,4-benzoquinol methylase
MVTTDQLIRFMRGRAANASFIDRLKIVYRPYICPFDDLINELEGQSPRIMDIGCGSGQFCLLLAEFTKAKALKGIEVSQELVNNANTLLSGYKDRIPYDFRFYNGTDLPDDIASYDVIFLVDVLHHVPRKQQEKFIRNIYEKMGKGSVLLLKDIDAGSPLVFFNKMHDLIFAREIGNELSFAAISEMAKQIGFTIESVKTKTLYVYPHYLIKLRK